MKSVMKHEFSRVPHAEIPRSSFDRSHGHKTTFDAGWLIPILVDEALPGDTFNCKMTAFARLATPLHPFMDNMYLDSFFFAVPLRLLWTNWQKFNGEQTDPGDSTDFSIPTMDAPAGGHLEGSLSDYFGIPTEIATLQHMSLYHRAYNLIYNEWFRDQNLQDSVVVDTDDGPDTSTDYTVLRRGKRHDYFTACLPWPQKGTAVALPLGTQAPISGLGVLDLRTTTASQTLITDSIGEGLTYAPLYKGDNSEVLMRALTQDGKLDVYADLTNATAATINQLREAFQIQKLYERDARGGESFTELLKSFWRHVSRRSAPKT